MWAEKGFRREPRVRRLEMGGRPVVRVRRLRRRKGWFGGAWDAGLKVCWRAERR